MTRILLVLLVSASMTHQAPAQTLDSLVDKNRVLLLFAPTEGDPRLQEQLRLLSHHAEEMKDRNLILIPLLEQSGPPTTPDILRTLHPPLLSAADQLSIRHRFRIAPTDFTAILLGKDGGEKLRSLEPLTMDQLNRTIDAMPMRREEMRKRNPNP